MEQSQKSGARGTLNAEVIVSKAIESADKEGIEALSMRKLAGSFGVTAMSIYNHVAGKEALLDLMLDRVVSEIESPNVGGPWDIMMRRRAQSMRHALLRHRWAVPLMMSRITTSEITLDDHEASLGCLVTAGFTYAQADWVRNAIDSHVYGYTIQELNAPVAPDAYRAAAAQYLPSINKERFPFLYEAARQIIDAKYDGLTDFNFGLELILEGIRRRYPQTHAERPIVRIAELEIDPGQIDAYRVFLKDEIAASVAQEPGVLMLSAQAVKGAPASVRLLEVYANEEAYQAHLMTPHFLKYKQATAAMVLSLRLIEMDPLLLAGKPAVFGSWAN